MTLRDRDGGTCRIYANDRGALQADFSRYTPDAERLHDQQERRAHVKMVLSSPELYFQDVPLERLPQQVWYGPEVAALVDARAQAGDLMLAFAEGLEGELKPLLILRSTPQDSKHFVVVGQGIVASGHDMTRLGARTCCCDLIDQRRHTRYLADHELDLSVKEVMAYIGQDFVGPKYYEWEFDVEKRLERLLRCLFPTLNASRTARMRVRRCFAHEDAAVVQSSGDEAEQEQQSEEPLSDEDMLEAFDEGPIAYDSMASSSDDSTSSEGDARLSLTEKYRAWQTKKLGPNRTLQDLRAEYEKVQAERRQDARDGPS